MTPHIRDGEEHDIDEILALINSYAQEGIILERTKEQIANSIEQFMVCESGTRIIGVITFYNYGENAGENLKEIRSLAVYRDYFRQGIGTLLLNHLIKRLSLGSGTVTIFALTYAPGFFQKNGFQVVHKETLPEKIWKDCYKCKHIGHCQETALVYNPASA